ncbi:MAG: thioredoxin-disulfide reductase [Deltaproteobacteria bacterium]|nr:thioredoxin-disulfide reductase [Deltaproteobacteria bacterium]MBW1920153.1 thioredoxin-disulfide reductase [Deltaproteobacteria bacterium]
MERLAAARITARRQKVTRYEVIIIGGGPAGLTAGLYTSRAGLRSLLIERGMFGGQMANATLVENYPGFPEGIAGPELGLLMHQQAVRYGLEEITTEVTGLTLTQGQLYGVSTAEGDFEAAAIIIAAGSEYRKLGVSGEETFSGRGISYCATCDGFFFRDQEVAVVGGGDTAITDALELSRHASKVYVIHRRDQLRAGKALQEQAFAHPKLEFIWDTVVDELLGNKVLEELKLRNVKTGQQSTLKVDGLFVAVGLMPNSHIFFDILDLDDAGYIIADEMMATSLPGIFAAGDIRRNSPRQIAAAVGDGVTAAMSGFKYIQEQGNGIRTANPQADGKS